jgi:glucose/arabinose dehydrogenase
MTWRRVAVPLVGALVVASCAGSDESSTPSVADTEVFTEVSAPPVEEPADEAGPAEPAPTQPTEPAVTTTLVPAADADLPTAAPSETDPSAPPTTLPGPLEVPVVDLVEVTSFDEPVGVATRSLDPRFFVVQQGGLIVAADAESDTVVLDMADIDGVELGTEGGEQGLLGLAFHPTLDLAYVNFTNADGTTIVAEIAHDPTTIEFDTSTYREVLSIEQPFANHNGGHLEFGPDGYLYIGTGDGGSAGDPNRAALDLSSRLGKLLRIDPTLGDDGRDFTVPTDNPFLGADDADPTIWSYGLRNPWKFSFDPLTNDLWIADVGQNQFEEIHLAPAVDGVDAGRGLSFGWSAFEGDAPFNDDQPTDGHVPPVVTYAHADGGCSVSGGVVARDAAYDDLNGWYVYGDFCSGQVWALDTTSVGVSDSTRVGEPVVVELANVPALVAVFEGPDGDIYAVSRSGPLLRLAQR